MKFLGNKRRWEDRRRKQRGCKRKRLRKKEEDRNKRSRLSKDRKMSVRSNSRNKKDWRNKNNRNSRKNQTRKAIMNRASKIQKTSSSNSKKTVQRKSTHSVWFQKGIEKSRKRNLCQCRWHLLKNRTKLKFQSRNRKLCMTLLRSKNNNLSLNIQFLTSIHLPILEDQ